MEKENPLLREFKRAGTFLLMISVGFLSIAVGYLVGFICQMLVLGFSKGTKALDIFPDEESPPVQ